MLPGTAAACGSAVKNSAGAKPNSPARNTPGMLWTLMLYSSTAPL
jgi:hypothetical protein